MKLSEVTCSNCGESFIYSVNDKKQQTPIDIKKGGVVLARFRLCGACSYTFNKCGDMKKFTTKFMKMYDKTYGKKSYKIATNEFKKKFIKKYMRQISGKRLFNFFFKKDAKND